jgi:hypothetical protein
MREAVEKIDLTQQDASAIRDPVLRQLARDIQFWFNANIGSLILLTVLLMVLFPAMNIHSAMRDYPWIFLQQFWFIPYLFIRWLTVSRIRETSLVFLKAIFGYDFLVCISATGMIVVPQYSYLWDLPPFPVIVVFTALAWPFVIIWNLFSLGKPRMRGIEIRALIYFPLFIFGWVLFYDYAYHHGWMLSLHGLVHGVD